MARQSIECRLLLVVDYLILLILLFSLQLLLLLTAGKVSYLSAPKMATSMRGLTQVKLKHPTLTYSGTHGP